MREGKARQIVVEDEGGFKRLLRRVETQQQEEDEERQETRPVQSGKASMSLANTTKGWVCRRIAQQASLGGEGPGGQSERRLVGSGGGE